MPRDEPVDLRSIRRCAIMAVEGEKDDISGVGQTLAALDLTSNLPAAQKAYYLQKGVGHYGVFNGARFRSEIAPRIADFIRALDPVARQPARAGKVRRQPKPTRAGLVPSERGKAAA